MKKIILPMIVCLAVFAGCGNTANTEASSSDPSVNETTASSLKESGSSSSSSSAEQKEIIMALNTPGEIKKDGKVMYTLEVTEVKDVTEEAKNSLVNDSNFLDFYSNGQAKQAVQITILMKNQSGKDLGLPFLDDVVLKDAAGITNVGGWKNDSTAKTEFGQYQLDGNNETDKRLYGITDGESKLASSTVLFATPSDEVEFSFKSTTYNDEVTFKLPIQK